MVSMLLVMVYRAAGVDIQSQQAYELAAKGLIRPKGKESGPIIYGMKCISFNPPEFTLGNASLKY